MHDFFATPITAGDFHLRSVAVHSEISAKLFRFRRDLSELKIAGMFRTLLDSRANLRLRRFTKAGQFRHAAGLACFPQLLDRADLEVLVERFDLFRAQPGNRKQFQDRLRKFRA